jgi:hypothetical protein
MSQRSFDCDCDFDFDFVGYIESDHTAQHPRDNPAPNSSIQTVGTKCGICVNPAPTY